MISISSHGSVGDRPASMRGLTTLKQSNMAVKDKAVHVQDEPQTFQHKLYDCKRQQN